MNTKGERMSQGIVRIPAGEGHSLWVLGEVVTHKVTSARTGGAYSLFEVASLPGTGPPPHVQHREEEAFWVLKGEYQFMIEGSTLTVSAGSLLYIPKGTLHAHKNVGDGVGRMLVTQTPGGLYEGFFDEAGVPGTDFSSPPPAPKPEELQRVAELGRKYGTEYPPEVVAKGQETVGDGAERR